MFVYRKDRNGIYDVFWQTEKDMKSFNKPNQIIKIAEETTKSIKNNNNNQKSEFTKLIEIKQRNRKIWYKIYARFKKMI